MHLQKTLEKYGLTAKQAKIYLATLELGSAPVNLIAKKSAIPRPSCYDILESLNNLGIASTFTKKKTRYYSVEDPRKIIKLAEQKAEDLKQVLPE
jgi:sugar-specific transcriptional regulator TrmB